MTGKRDLCESPAEFKMSGKRPATLMYWPAEDMIMDEVIDGSVKQDELGNKWMRE